MLPPAARLGEMALWSRHPIRWRGGKSCVRGLNRENASPLRYSVSRRSSSVSGWRKLRLPPLIGDSISRMALSGQDPGRNAGGCELAHWSASAWDSGRNHGLIELAAEYCRRNHRSRQQRRCIP